MKIAIVGGGAMGLLWGGLLGERSHELWLVEKDASRYEVLRERGYLCYHAEAGAAEHIPIHAVRRIESLPIKELAAVILAVKAYQVEQVLAELLPLLSSDAPVLCLANGAGFGGDGGRQDSPLPGQVFFAVSFQGAYLAAPGEVYCRGAGAVYWGSLPSASPGCTVNETSRKALARLLSGVPGCVYREDFVRELWQKLLINSVINPLTALWQVENGGLAEGRLTVEQQKLKENLLQEGLAVAEAYGRLVLDRRSFLSSEQMHLLLEDTIRRTAENYSSMYQDVVQDKKTEIDYINGYLIAWGERLRVATPWQKALFAQVSRLTAAAQT